MSITAEVAVSYQLALKNQLDVTANNIANMSSSGFQGSHPLFSQYMVDASDAATQIAYVQDSGTVRNVDPGPLNATGNKLDVGIQGKGYFVVEKDGQFFYTRNGAFRLDADGMLVTAGGHVVLDEDDNPIVFAEDETSIEITRDGAILTENGEIARFRVVNFANEQDMQLVGSSVMKTDQIPIDAGDDTEIVQGMLEGSNVVAIVEMTRMIDLLRSYQSAAKLIEAEDNRQDDAIEILTKTV